ncbi:carbamoyl phosphate synthase small subunit [Salisediminibacterium beveridgei]|uniref:Carbamoyl phosphate synthase small chain n=1 Tax=Salisediminibacterium beveridgei TaxID=632773 RepID=A0A1D7QVE0_9BACI|nr:carbamoyl phosphate synthase small subunit [Salisediminibacterium beveridgei]AOM82980.1 Carbamoyl-phosphate synthase small chain [Salisediminibacterium beveridgei]
MNKGYLVLETGDILEGKWIGHQDETMGEVVFNTSMTGYQEMITDPSYAGQIVTLCYPLVGNYGMNPDDNESQKPACQGVIVGESCDQPSNGKMTSSFSDQLATWGIPGLAEVNTRKLVSLIRKHKTLKGKITANPKTVTVFPEPLFAPGQLVEQVAVEKAVSYIGQGKHVILLDFGYKASILNDLLKQNVRVTVVPYDTSLKEIQNMNPDGILISNGPGNPDDHAMHFPKIKALTDLYPTLGICLGHQLIAMAYGASSKKMAFGHRGGNHPVLDHETGKIWITSQNHSYEIDPESCIDLELAVRFTNVNDTGIEGFFHPEKPVTTVQFHPEARPGPVDTDYIFDEFIESLVCTGGKSSCQMQQV